MSRAHVIVAIVSAFAVLGSACGGELAGTWSSAAAETRVVDVTVNADLTETVTADTTASHDDAHAFVFNGDGTGTVTTRAIFNLLNLSYLELDQPTETPLQWTTGLGSSPVTITTSDGVSGEWVVSGDIVLEREERLDSDGQYTTRTTTLSLRR